MKHSTFDGRICFRLRFTIRRPPYSSCCHFTQSSIRQRIIPVSHPIIQHNMNSKLSSNISQLKSSTTTSNVDTTSAASNTITSVPTEHFDTASHSSEQRLFDVYTGDQAALRKIAVTSCQKTLDLIYYSSGTPKQVQASMKRVLSTFKKLRAPYDYGIADGSLFFPPEGGDLPKTSDIKRQLVEWVSEGQRSDLPTFQEALEETRDSGSAYNKLGVALRQASRFREKSADERMEYLRWKESMEDVEGEVEGGGEYGVSGAAPSSVFDQYRTAANYGNDLLTQ